MADNDRTFPTSKPQANRAEGAGRNGGDLGAGTPAGVDIHDVGQEDTPQDDWGEPAAEGAAYSANHTRRGIKTEAERGQGKLTRARTKDIISRRG